MHTNHLRGAVLVVGAIAWAMCAGPARAADPHDAQIANRAALAAKTHPGLADYLSAAQALEQGNIDQCIAGLDKAIAADGNRPLYHLARGAVLVLAGRLADAPADLARGGAADDGGCLLAYGPQPQPEAMMWSAAIDQLAGRAQPFAPNHRAGFTFWQKTPYETQVMQWMQAGGPNAPAAQQQAMRYHLAERLLTVPDVLPMRLKEADDLLSAGQADKALPILRQVGTVIGDDPAWLSLDADAHLAAGYAGSARLEYDRVLFREPDNASAYLAHALVSAHIGAIGRAKYDLAVAATLDPAATAQFHQQHDAELSALENAMPKEDMKTLTQQFLDAAKAGEDDQKLADRALRLRYAVNAIRRVPEEKYIDGIRRRLNAIKANPKDAAAWADLSTYIYQESLNKYGQGKGGGVEWIADCVDAMFYADQALRLDPNNIQAIATKGWLCEQDNQEKDALTLAQNGLRIVPGYPRLANLQGELLQVSAIRTHQQAGNLRSTKFGTIFTPDAIITWSRSPSQAELDEARQYDAMSTANVATANHDLLVGWRHFSDSVVQMDVIADYLDYHGQQQQAIDIYKKVLSLDPNNETALSQLEDVYKDNHQPDDASELQFRLDNVFATSATAMIDKATSEDQAQNMAAAKTDIDRALATDPSDARVYVELAHMNVNTDAAAWNRYTRCAVAMSEAQMRINHESFAVGAPGTLAAADAQLVIGVLKNRAQYLRQTNHSADADAIDKQLADINRRIALGNVYLGTQDSPPAWQVARLQWEKQLIANGEMADAARFCIQAGPRDGQWHADTSGEEYQIEYPVYRYLAPRLYHFQLWHFFGPTTLQNYENYASMPHPSGTGTPPAPQAPSNFMR